MAWTAHAPGCCSVANPFNGNNTKFLIADKRFYLVSHLVDKVIAPVAYEHGVDLYAGDAHVGLANVWFYTGHAIFPGGHWDRVLHAFPSSIQLRNPIAYTYFDDVVTAAAQYTHESMQEFAAPLLLARGRLHRFIGVFGDSCALPVVPC